MTKKSSIVAKETVFDSIQNKTVSIPKQIPVLIRYTTQDGKHWEKKPDEDDLKVIEKINSLTIPYWYPTDAVKKGDKTQEAINKGITSVDFFFQKKKSICIIFDLG